MRAARGWLLVLALGACSSDPQEPHGSPVLLEVDWVTTVGRAVIYTAGADAGTSATVPGAGTEVDFVFDRRLDGTRIEDLSGGVTSPKANPPVSVSWPGRDAADAGTAAGGAFSDQVFYNPTPVFGGETAYVYLRPLLPGFPSATPVTFTLDPHGLTSAYGDPMTGPTSIEAMVAPMTVVPSGAASADALQTFSSSYAFPVRFSNRLPTPISALAPFAHARAGGVELPVTLAGDPQDPTRLFVSPASCLGGWPAGAVVAVTFDAGLLDAFGVPTTAPLAGGSLLIAGDGAEAGALDASTGCGGDAAMP